MNPKNNEFFNAHRLWRVMEEPLYMEERAKSYKNNIFKIWWTAEALKLLLNSKEIMSSENAPHLDVIEVVLVYCNIVNNWNHCNSWVLSTFVPNKPFGELLIFHEQIIFTQKHFTQSFSTWKHGLLIKTLNP